MKNREHNRLLPTLILVVFALLGGLIIQQWLVYRSESSVKKQFQLQAGVLFSKIESRVTKIEKELTVFQTLSLSEYSDDTVFVKAINVKCQNVMAHFPEVVSIWLITDNMLPSSERAFQNCYVLDSLLRSEFVWSEKQNREQLLVQNSSIMRLYERARRKGESSYSDLFKHGEQWSFQMMVPVFIAGRAPIYLAVLVDLSFVDNWLDTSDSKANIATLLLTDVGDIFAVSRSPDATLPPEEYSTILFQYYPEVVDCKYLSGSAWSGYMGEELFLISTVSQERAITSGWVLVKFYSDSQVSIYYSPFRLLLFFIYFGAIFMLFILFFRRK